MNSSIKNVLDSKKKENKYQVMFDEVRRSDTPIAFIEYVSRLARESDNVIKENVDSLLENTITLRFLKTFANSQYCTIEDLGEINAHIDERIKSISELSCDDNMINDLNDTKNKINNIIECRSTMEWLKVDTKYQFARRRFDDCCLFEASALDDLELIRYTINISPDAVNRYAKVLSRVETESYSRIEQSLPRLLELNTQMILGLDVVLSGRTMTMVSSMPKIIVDRVIKDGSKKQKKSFINIITKHIYEIRDHIQRVDQRQYDILSCYLDVLYEAYDALNNYSESTSVKEHIADMQPDVIMYEEGVIEDPVAELEDSLADIIFDDADEIDSKALENLIILSNKINNMYVVDEAGKVTKIIRKGAYKASDASKKLASKVSDMRSNAKRTATAINKGVQPFTNMVSKILDDIKNMDSNERRERIIKGDFKHKLFGAIKKGITMIIAWQVGGAISPMGGVVGLIVGAIAVLTSIAIDKKLDDKTRREIIRELETELAVVNEKLEDSRGDENKQNKYQLIRIKKKLEADLDRIRYNISKRDKANIKTPNH